VANSAIEQYNPDGGEDHTWVFIDGQYNRVDHNVFTGKRGAGQTLRVWRNGKADHHRIDHNAFLDRAPLGDNGGETIQIGVSKYQTSASYTTIENNYFEACDGEAEIISVKSGKNTVRNNTLVRNAGAITLRHGHESKVYGHYIRANGKAGAAGIRVYGYDHQIYNNYIDGVETRSSTFGGIAIHSGDIQSRTDTSTGTIPATNVSIMHNTFVNSRVAFVFGNGKTYQPSGIKMANNLIARQLDSVIYNVDGIKNLSATANIYEASLGTIVSGFSKQTADMKAVQRNGYTLWKPSDTSSVINAGDNALTVSSDIEGVSRDATPDVGAHEFGNGPKGPLRKQETGAQWYW
jgi:poly(beta-D-mannuronate) lyase